MEDNQQQQTPLPRRSRGHLRQALLLIPLAILLVAMLMPGVRSSPSPKRERCVNNMKDLALAILNYETKHGHFPPAYTADASGKPLHSWRVLILPFLGQEDLYKQYDFTEPWNGPHNSRLVKKCPKVFQCPSAKNRDSLGNQLRGQ